MSIVPQRFLDLEAGVSGDDGSQDTAEYSDHDLSDFLDDEPVSQDTAAPLFVPWDPLSPPASPRPARSASFLLPPSSTHSPLDFDYSSLFSDSEDTSSSLASRPAARRPAEGREPPKAVDPSRPGGLPKDTPSSARARLWCFTRNQRDDEDELPAPWTELPKGASWLYFSQEQAARTHYQGAVYFSNAKTLSAVVKLLGAGGIHVERAFGTAEQSKAYCSKAPVRGPWELGEMPVQGRRTDLDAACDAVQKRGYEEAFMEHPSICAKYSRGLKELDFICRKRARNQDRSPIPPKIIVLIGPPGAGKSLKARSLLPEEDLYVKSPNKWWDGYSSETVVLLDDFYGGIPYHELLTYLDQYPVPRETKGGYCLPVVKTWIITSNKEPWNWYSSTINQDALMSRLYSGRFEAQLVWMERGKLDVPLACPAAADLPWNKPVAAFSHLPVVNANTYPF